MAWIVLFVFECAHSKNTNWRYCYYSYTSGLPLPPLYLRAQGTTQLKAEREGVHGLVWVRSCHSDAMRGVAVVRVTKRRRD